MKLAELESHTISFSFLVPFCHTVDLGAPSTIKGTTSIPSSRLQPHPPNSSQPAYQREVGSQLPIEYDSSADWDSADVTDKRGRVSSRALRARRHWSSLADVCRSLCSCADSHVPWQIAEEGEPGISAGRLRGTQRAVECFGRCEKLTSPSLTMLRCSSALAQTTTTIINRLLKEYFSHNDNQYLDLSTRPAFRCGCSDAESGRRHVVPPGATRLRGK